MVHTLVAFSRETSLMSNWQKLKGKLTSQGVIKPKVVIADTAQQQPESIDGKRKKKQLERESNVAAIKAQHLRNFVKSKYIGLDCEMVGLGLNGKESALARCCCVDFDGNILYDKFVRPQGFVTDFRTEWSGVRKKDLRQGQAIAFSQCQEEVAELLKGRILVGHALKNDLDVLMLSHPRQMIRDTAKYRPYMRSHGKHGKFRPRALKDLTQQFLGVKIQSGEHNPAEDANSAMQLYRLKMDEWEEGLRESKLKAKQAAVEKQKAAKEGVKASSSSSSVAVVASKKNDVSSSKQHAATEQDDNDSEGEQDNESSGAEESDSESEGSEESSEKEEVQTKHNKKKFSSGNSASNKGSTDGVKRKVVTSSMFGAPVVGASGGSKLKSIADIDMEMAAKKRKMNLSNRQ